MTNIKIPALKAVAMHHFGHTRLALGVSYTAVREPWNQHDANAVAIKDGLNTKAYFARCDAKRLAPLMDSGLLGGPVCVVFYEDPVVKSQRLGPHQLGNVAFRCKDRAAVEKLLKETGLNYELY